MYILVPGRRRFEYVMSSVCNGDNCYFSRQSKDSDVLMSSVYNYTHIGGNRGKEASAGVGMGSQIRQLTLDKVPAEMRIHSLVQGAAFPSKGFSFHI
jgi:hypothetical protein